MAQLLHGKAVAVDPGGGARRLRDLDIVLPSERRIAVEVTRYTIPVRTEQYALARKYDQPMRGLHSTWIVGAPRNFSVKNFRKRLLLLLNALDGNPPLNLNVDRDPMDENIRSDLQSLRVRYVVRVSEAEPSIGGRILLNNPPDVGTADADLITDAVNHCVAKHDNVAKLNVPDAESRVLFIWVDSSQSPYSAALWGEVAPTRAPNLPGLINEVWIATATEPAALWIYSAAHGWSDRLAIAV